MPNQNIAHKPPSRTVTVRFGKIDTYIKKPPRLTASATERKINKQRSIMTLAVQLSDHKSLSILSFGPVDALVSAKVEVTY
jgi:hypothetical protein